LGDAAPLVDGPSIPQGTPLKTLKSTVKQILPRDWWDALRRAKQRSPYLVSPRAMAHLHRIKEQDFDPGIVIDVGAAHGDWTRSCRQIFPDARFVMLEPLPEYHRELTELARQERIHYIPAAAGRAKDELQLLVPEDPTGSSFLPASRRSDTYFKKSVKVPVVPLASLDIPEETSLLKLDVQGYELEVLAGAGRVMRQVEVIVAECSLYPFQENIPLIHESVEHVVDLGFRLYDIADEVRWPSGTLAQIDLVFVAAGSQLLQSSRWG
jgi:FkbM family methyltransferase